jgi:hypothetical protein
MRPDSKSRNGGVSINSPTDLQGNEYYATLRTPAGMAPGAKIDIASIEPYPQYSKTKAYAARNLMHLNWLSSSLDKDLGCSVVRMRFSGPEIDFSNYRQEFCCFGEKALEKGMMEIVEIITFDDERLKPEVLRDIIFRSAEGLDADAKHHLSESKRHALSVLDIHLRKNTPHTLEAFSGQELKRLAHYPYINGYGILRYLAEKYPLILEEYKKERQEFHVSPLGKLMEEMNRKTKL